MLIGKRINGRYKIVEMIGGGGMANVYLAQDMILEREVAIKILRMDFSNDEEFIKRFNREAQSATSLAHPNIVSIYDVGEDQDIYYIVMEYVKGYTLKQYIQYHQHIPIETTLHIMEQITLAIAHAHQHGIIHRDIKPQNILIDEIENVKITDFGIATALSATSITQTNAVLGSVHYLSPEQARGGMVNKKSDIYSLGIVMFELLTGRLPFSGESAISIALKHLQSTTPSPRRWNPSIPQSVENIVLKATAKDPFHRYDNVEEMKADITTALSPDRKGEKPFVVPEDMDATKAIPVITQDTYTPEQEDTIVLNDQTQAYSDSYDEEPPKKQKVKKNKAQKGITKTKTKTKKEKNNQKKPKSKFKKIVIALLFLVAILAVLIIAVLPKLMEPSDISVPNVEGKELNDAIALLDEKGFEIGKTTELPNEEIEKGKVIGTDPEAGKKVSEGSKVDILISSAKNEIEIDDYRERSYESLKGVFDNIGFKSIDISYEYNDQIEEGLIINQDPQPGSSIVPSDTVLHLTISKGQNLITLKDLRGYSKTALEDYIQESGLIVKYSRESFSDTIPEGSVVQQSPNPGSKLKKGSKVYVVISKGKEELPPKTVSKEITIPYEPVNPGDEQEVIIYIQDMKHDMTDPADKFTITATTKKTLTFQIAPNQKAGFKVFRDNKVIMDESIPYP